MSDEKLWLFNGENFGNWKFRIEVLMEDRGLLECLETAITDQEYAEELPDDTAEERQRKKKLLDERMAKDRRCKNLLIHRIAEDQLEYAKEHKTAKDIWDELKNNFERIGIAGKLILKKQFQELRLAEGGDVKAFLLRFEKILRELRTAEVNITRRVSIESGTHVSGELRLRETWCSTSRKMVPLLRRMMPSRCCGVTTIQKIVKMNRKLQ